MGIEITHKLKCDYRKDDKPCGKSFILSDPPPPGVEHTVSSRDAMGNELFFCHPLHLIAYWVAYLKATPTDKKDKTNPATERPKVVQMPNNKQIEKLKQLGIIAEDDGNAHKAMEELESIPPSVPPAPEDLNLGE